MKKFSFAFFCLLFNTTAFSAAEHAIDRAPFHRILPSIMHPLAIGNNYARQTASIYEAYDGDFDFGLPESDDMDSNEIIIEYTDKDILIDNYEQYYDHPVNSYFRNQVASYRGEYKSSSERAREALIWNILALVKGNGSRFLQYYPEGRIWKQLSNRQARIKIHEILNGASTSSRQESRARQSKQQTKQQSKRVSHSQLNHGQYRSKSSYKGQPIFSYTDLDVLIGRGKKIKGHVGNLYFREFVVPYRQQYLASKRNEKTQLINDLLAYIKDSGVRFLKFNKSQGAFFEMSDHKAREKISQAILKGIIYFDDYQEKVKK